jgi:DNA-binding CsgD family transcriptional regulator
MSGDVRGSGPAYARAMPAARSRTIHAVLDRLDAVADSRSYRAEVVSALRDALGFEWFAWVGTDPATAVGVDPLASVPDLHQLPRIVRLRYQTPVNRWTTLGGVAALGDRAEDSLIWREVLRDHGVSDVASAVFRDPFGTWGFLDLWSARPYDADDLALLTDLAPRLTAVQRRQQGLLFDDVAADPPSAAGPAVLLLDDDLEVVGQTPASDALLEVLLPRADGFAPVPACAYNVAAQLLAREGGVDDHEAMARVHLADGRWLTLRASRVSPGNAIAVAIEQSTPGERLDVFSRCHGLTVRERELLSHLGQGHDTREVAVLMFLSPHTVQDHLKSIFAKTGTRSRRLLLARALGRGLSAPG